MQHRSYPALLVVGIFCLLVNSCRSEGPEVLSQMAAVPTVTKPAPTAVPTQPATATATQTAIPSATPTNTATATQTATPTPSLTPTATPDALIYGQMDTVDPANTAVIFWHSYEGFAQTVLDEIVADFN